MDHATIEEQSLIERYHQGDLTPEVEARFEAHFMACPQCQFELEVARGMRVGLRTMAAEDAAGAMAAAQLGVLAWLARRSRGMQAVLLLTAVLIAAGLPSALLLTANRQLRTAAEEARGTSTDWQTRYASEQALVAETQAQLADSERRWDARHRELEDRLATLAATLGEHTSPLARPLVNTPVFLLQALRGESGEPTVTIDLRRTGEVLAIAVDVDEDPRWGSYRVTVTGAGGERLFRRADLVPNSLETLLITFPANLFAPGDYGFTVEGLTADGMAVAVGEYSFRVVGPP